MKKISIIDSFCFTPLGYGNQENFQALLDGKSQIKPHYFSENLKNIFCSRIENSTIENLWKTLHSKKNFSRFEKIIILSILPILKKNPPTPNDVLLLSTTKGNISQLNSKENHEILLFNTAKKISDFLGFKKKPIIISNACVSGVLSIGVAKNLISANLYSKVYIVAGDEVSNFILSGFQCFNALSNEPARPYDLNRKGINLGEAGASAIITETLPENNFEILGYSSINDAQHISAPSRKGNGLYQSIKNTLTESQIHTKDIDFISAHGTATIYNDEMESLVFKKLNLDTTPLHSLKGFFGHTLGASGLLETIIAMESAKQQILIPTKNFSQNGTTHPLNIITENQTQPIQHILKTASGFGGCNTALILKYHKNKNNV